jgi:hypothetical protein
MLHSESRKWRVAHAQSAGGGLAAGRGWRERANVFIRFSGWAVKAHALRAKGGRVGWGFCACAQRAGSSGRAWRGLFRGEAGEKGSEGKRKGGGEG